MRRALITGASGFVGANLARRVVQAGSETHLFLRPGYQRWRLEEIAADIHLHEIDLQDFESVRAAVRAIRPDWVFHLAAYGAYSSQTGFSRMAATNLMGCVSLLDACVETGVGAFLQTGSSSEYGYKDHAAGENEIIQPNGHYAITKAAATHYCQYTARQTGINALTVRLYSIYGPYEEPSRLIPSLLVHGLRGRWPALVSPDIARDFVYVDDAVDAMLALAAAPSPPRGSVFNICTGVQSSLRSVVSATRELLRIEAEPEWSTMPARSWDTSTWVGCPTALSDAIGWRARTGLAAGLRRTVEWFRDNPRWLEYYSSQIFQATS